MHSNALAAYALAQHAACTDTGATACPEPRPALLKLASAAERRHDGRPERGGRR
jgi:hypothetical protein